MSSYWEKLQDPRWQKRRLEIFGRAEFKCEECGNGKLQLHCHHKIYHKGREPWDYPDKELACLCDPCHEKWHEVKDVLNAILVELSIDRMRELLSYGVALAMQDGKATKCTLYSWPSYVGFSNAFQLDPAQVEQVTDETAWVHIDDIRELQNKRGSK